MRGKFRFILAAVLLSFFAASSASADFRTDPYLGAGFGIAAHDGCEDRFLNTTGVGLPEGVPVGADASTVANFCADVVTANAGAAKGFIGFRFHDLLAIEAAYYNLGTSWDDDFRTGFDDRTFGDRFEVSGGSVALLAILPVDDGAQLFVKIGGFFGSITESDPDFGNLNEEGMRIDESGISFMAGVGGEFKIGPMFTLRGEVEWIPNVADGAAGNESSVNNTNADGDTADIDVIFTSVSLVWHILGAQPNKAYIDTCGDCSEGLSSALGAYMGGGGSLVSFNGGENRSQFGTFHDNISDIKAGGRGFAGYRFHKYVAVELGYDYFNIAHDDDNSSRVPQAGPDTFEAQGISASILGVFPVFDRTSVFAKVGVIWGFLEERDPNNDMCRAGGGDVTRNSGACQNAFIDRPPEIQFTEDGASILLGIGMNWDLTRHITLRGEIDWIPDIGAGTREYAIIKQAELDANPEATFENDDAWTGATAEIDIISSSMNLIWNFR